jgi:ABC-type sugar transport system substrate-binding protein
MTTMEFKARKMLVEEALDFASFNRRSLLVRTGALAGASLLGGSFARTADAEEIKPATGGKKVRIGIPLTYGPFNQPWRRGCWQLVQTVLDLGGEPVTIRGEPTKASEQDAERSLLDRNIDCLCMGIYSLESETAYIADEAKKRGIETVGFAVPVKDSPSVVEDTWATATTLGYYVHNALGHRGTIVQTAEDKGFYTPFDMEADMLDLMTKYETRMKMLPFMPGSVSTNDQISKGRENALALLQAHPQPGSVNAIVSWWWPLILGAGQALKQQNRTDVRLFNHYFSDQLLKDMAAKTYPIEFSTDVPWHTLGKKTGELAMALARGDKVEPIQYRVPVTAIVQEEAAGALAEVQKMDKQAIALLGQYGG